MNSRLGYSGPFISTLLPVKTRTYIKSTEQLVNSTVFQVKDINGYVFTI